jgi:hypothetical protein
MLQGIIGMRWNAFRPAFIIKKITMSNPTMICTTYSQDLLTVITKHFANKGMDYEPLGKKGIFKKRTFSLLW